VILSDSFISIWLRECRGERGNVDRRGEDGGDGDGDEEGEELLELLKDEILRNSFSPEDFESEENVCFANG
jgi:hypothetical protein